MATLRDSEVARPGGNEGMRRRSETVCSTASEIPAPSLPITITGAGVRGRSLVLYRSRPSRKVPYTGAGNQFQSVGQRIDIVNFCPGESSHCRLYDFRVKSVDSATGGYNVGYAEPIGQPDYGAEVARILYVVKSQNHSTAVFKFSMLRYLVHGHDLLRHFLLRHAPDVGVCHFDQGFVPAQ